MLVSQEKQRSYIVPRALLTLLLADFICNHIGNYNAVKRVGGDELDRSELKAFNINGKKMGEFKTVNNLSWLRVYDAGHEVPAYQPEVAFEAFKQTMSNQPITSPS